MQQPSMRPHAAAGPAWGEPMWHARRMGRELHGLVTHGHGGAALNPCGTLGHALVPESRTLPRHAEIRALSLESAAVSDVLRAFKLEWSAVWFELRVLLHAAPAQPQASSSSKSHSGSSGSGSDGAGISSSDCAGSSSSDGACSSGSDSSMGGACGSSNGSSHGICSSSSEEGCTSTSSTAHRHDAEAHIAPAPATAPGLGNGMHGHEEAAHGNPVPLMEHSSCAPPSPGGVPSTSSMQAATEPRYPAMSSSTVAACTGELDPNESQQSQPAAGTAQPTGSHASLSDTAPAPPPAADATPDALVPPADIPTSASAAEPAAEQSVGPTPTPAAQATPTAPHLAPEADPSTLSDAALKAYARRLIDGTQSLGGRVTARSRALGQRLLAALLQLDFLEAHMDSLLAQTQAVGQALNMEVAVAHAAQVHAADVLHVGAALQC